MAGTEKLEDEAEKIVREAAGLRSGMPGHTAKRIEEFVGEIRKLIRKAKEQTQSDDLTMLTGEDFTELQQGKHKKETG